MTEKLREDPKCPENPKEHPFLNYQWKFGENSFTKSTENSSFVCNRAVKPIGLSREMVIILP